MKPHPEVIKFLSAAAAQGGKSKSPAKVAASRANGSRPPKPGSRPRGRPVDVEVRDGEEGSRNNL